MPSLNSNRKYDFIRGRFILPLAVIFGILLFILTYLGIQKSRSDNLQLLRRQGAALLESLTLSADNAIKANTFFDLLVQEKFSDLAGFLETRPNLEFSAPELADFASGYGVDAILIFDNEMNLKASGARSVFVNINSIYGYIIPAMKSLLADTVNQTSFQFVEGNVPGDVRLYFLTRTSDQKYVIVIASDALFYSQAKENIGIGFLVQNIAREVGVEYIMFQTMEGIIFSSRKIGPVLKIEKDPFLQAALAADSVVWREYESEGAPILELAKRFSSVEYSEGIFRLGIPLDKYYEIVAGYNRQMIFLSFLIFAALLLAALYLSGKQKRIYLDQSYRQMKSLSEKVFESINAGIIAVGCDGRVEMVNRQFLNIFEAVENDVVGRQWSALKFHSIISLDKVLFGEKKAGEDEEILRIPAGNKHLLINTGRIHDEKGNLTGAVAVIYDYTHIRELEESARRRERLTELGDLAAGVAHEIRNPLNAISIAAQRLLGEFEPKENIDEFNAFAGQIKTEAGRLNDIVNRFLSMARDRGKALQNINISGVLDDTIKLVDLGIQRDDIKIVADIQPEVFASVSEDRFKQLVINLVRNAVQACEKMGGEVIIGFKEESESLILSVKDTGPGIPENIRNKIFTPYFTTRDKGTGLGLSIVHQIVEEFGGRIEVFSPEGGGAEFRVKIPK
ncbi:MAG TPA: PAS domain-containing protein [candidate division Zixibacteria bacterium]|nr:PAS domain-containing protein [candidate division Zixibacteria bacterium]